MKPSILLFVGMALCLSSCQMIREVNSSTSAIQRNRCAVEQSTRAIEQNVRALERITANLQQMEG